MAKTVENVLSLQINNLLYDFDILTRMQFDSGKGKNTTLAINETMEQLMKDFGSKLATFIV